MTENALSKEIVDAAFRIHTTLGPGLFESVHETVLPFELTRRGLEPSRQQMIPIVYENIRIDTYLRLTGKRLGLLINFNVALIRGGIILTANGLDDASL